MKSPTLLIFSALLLLASCKLLSVHHSTPDITPDIMDDLLDIIDATWFTTTATVPPIKKLLRTAFHDCMGGCDASLNLNNSDNRGLTFVAEFANVAFSNKGTNYSTLSAYLSRSDYWALVESRALAWAIKAGNNSAPFSNSTPSFVYGRGDNPAGTSADDVEGNFPDGRANWTLPSTDTNHPTTVMEGLGAGLPGVSQTDIVVLMGLHGSGTTFWNNSGFNGPWSSGSSLNVVDNSFYTNLLGVGSRNSYTQQAATSNTTSSNDGVYYSSPPSYNKLQWVKGNSTTTLNKMMLNADMLIYHNFTSDSTGAVSNSSKLFCPQSNNATLNDCSSTNSSYMPLSTHASLAYTYAKSVSAYLTDLLPSYLRLLNVTSEFTTTSSLRGFYPEVVCEDGQQVCSGDIFFSGCGVTLTTC